MARGAILPANFRDPTGIDKVERGAIRDFERRIRMIKRFYVAEMYKIPASLVVNAKYFFLLDSYTVDALLNVLSNFVDSVLLTGSTRAPWLFESYVKVAYQRGTNQTFQNLSVQSPAYSSGRGDFAAILRSEPYQRRLGLQRARTYESMKGLSEQVKSNMGRVLTEGVARGQNPRIIAKQLTQQAGIEQVRARKIARTEVPMALRRARWDERDQAAEDFKINTRLLHISALSPSTRVSHARRHGKLFTSEEVRDWYSVDGNAINCKCAQSEILVDKNGKAVVQSTIDRARQNYEIMKKRSEAEWAKE